MTIENEISGLNSIRTHPNIVVIQQYGIIIGTLSRRHDSVMFLKDFYDFVPDSDFHELANWHCGGSVDYCYHAIDKALREKR